MRSGRRYKTKNTNVIKLFDYIEKNTDSNEKKQNILCRTQNGKKRQRRVSLGEEHL